MINRRDFMALAAAAVIDPERLLFVPGRRLISIPAPVKKHVIHVTITRRLRGKTISGELLEGRDFTLDGDIITFNETAQWATGGLSNGRALRYAPLPSDKLWVLWGLPNDSMVARDARLVEPGATIRP